MLDEASATLRHCSIDVERYLQFRAVKRLEGPAPPCRGTRHRPRASPLPIIAAKKLTGGQRTTSTDIVLPTDTFNANCSL